MKDGWRYTLFRKFMYFTVPALSLLIIAIVWGTDVLIPIVIPVIALGVAIPAVEIIAHFCPGIFYSAQWRKHPKPTLSIARSLKKERKYNQAVEELRRLAETNSQELDIWLELIETALIDMNDKKLGEDIFRDAYSIIEKEDKRMILKRFYSNVS
jgi:hypothetical protein